MSAIFTKKNINCKGKLLNFSKPVVMGILNVTTDSFYKLSRYNTEKEIVERTQQIISEGGTIVDIGAYSSRPGADFITQKEELEKLELALKIINKNFSDLIISVDTFRADIAKKVVNEFGVSIINDISAGELDNKMFRTISELNVPYIIMHMKGKPENMQQNPVYENMIKEIIMYFSEKIDKLKYLGVKDIIIDPGFGFGKTLEDNYLLMNRLDNFSIFDLPILVGISRKSMIYKLLNISPDEALNGTTVLNTFALQKGADILRVHDVKHAVEAVNIFNILNLNKNDIS